MLRPFEFGDIIEVISRVGTDGQGELKPFQSECLEYSASVECEMSSYKQNNLPSSLKYGTICGVGGNIRAINFYATGVLFLRTKLTKEQLYLDYMVKEFKGMVLICPGPRKNSEESQDLLLFIEPRNHASAGRGNSRMPYHQNNNPNNVGKVPPFNVSAAPSHISVTLPPMSQRKTAAPGCRRLPRSKISAVPLCRPLPPLPPHLPPLLPPSDRPESKFATQNGEFTAPAALSSAKFKSKQAAFTRKVPKLIDIPQSNYPTVAKGRHWRHFHLAPFYWSCYNSLTAKDKVPEASPGIESRMEGMICFLLCRNAFYISAGLQFSDSNLADIFPDALDKGVPQAVEICCRPDATLEREGYSDRGVDFTNLTDSLSKQSRFSGSSPTYCFSMMVHLTPFVSQAYYEYDSEAVYKRLVCTVVFGIDTLNFHSGYVDCEATEVHSSITLQMERL
ncbi:hypothetical protein K438DRAFT_1772359 [Mycena galopus ATCC 62051]|nr:hypothetical protein K438DRAFT_1772359 [Mycena galopus ATCC 62051]